MSSFILTQSTLKVNRSNETLPEWSGFLLIGASSFFWGSNYIPVKQYETGDGMFFQLILCIAIWVVGFTVNVIRNFPYFYAFPLLSGFLWSTANVFTVPIIKTIGIGLGMMFWSSISLVTGWITVRFGFCGLIAEEPTKPVFNYVGISLILASTIVYLFVKSETQIKEFSSTNVIYDYTIQNLNENAISTMKFYDRLSSKFKYPFGIGLSVIAGILYGQSYTPIVYVRNNYENASQNNLDYMFSFTTGIFVTSILYFITYCMIKKNKPILYPEIILPGLASGVCFALATVCFHLSVNALNQAISSPIGNCGPPIIASLWGIFLYKEIKGRKNLIVLSFGFILSILGGIFTGLSF